MCTLIPGRSVYGHHDTPNEISGLALHLPPIRMVWTRRTFHPFLRPPGGCNSRTLPLMVAYIPEGL